MCNNIVTDKAIIDDIKVLIFESMQTVAYKVNSAVCLLNWNIGKHISIDNRDYYIDLLFYHRRLKCLVAIDLKIGEFDAAYKG